MRLKKYQIKALETLSSYLTALSEAEANIGTFDEAIAALPEHLRSSIPKPESPVVAAWNVVRNAGVGASPDPWRELKDGIERSIPHICLKLPTGGGKTLLAAHGVERIAVDHFRRTTGLVLWIVPSEAIYTQTKKQLTDRENPIRLVLDRLSGGRVKILEKLDGFNATDLDDRLCILLLMLPSANRANRETLKMFSNSGRYESFFPPDDLPRAQALLDGVPNLEVSDLADATDLSNPASRIKHSLGNVLRIVRPIVVLDEGHHAYAEQARSTLSTFNPRFILELTATPKREFSNILVDVPGLALRHEEMIKLPIRLIAEKNRPWKKVLQDALDQLDQLAKDAQLLRENTGRYIRPIMLVRVDLTGKDQRQKSGELVHSEDVYEYLTQTAGLQPDAVRRQTAEIKELKDDDLLSEYCGVRSIITKDALREGWDCPFAYVLTVLSGGTAKTALTQMIGRVLRQPEAKLTREPSLDRAYVFCKDVEVAKAVTHIKDGLEKEGMGDLGGAIETGKGGKATDLREIHIREAFCGSRIMVPKVLHRDGKKGFRELEFDGDILPHIGWESFSYRNADAFALADYDAARVTAVDVDIARGDAFGVSADKRDLVANAEAKLDRPALVRRMLDVIPNPWQGMRILDDALARLRAREGVTEAQIIGARFELVKDILADIGEQFDEAAEAVFREKVANGDIVFKLLGPPQENLNITFEEMMTVRVPEGDLPLFRRNTDPLERSLYDKVFRKDVNGFEEDVALYLDGRDAVDWWWRIVARKGWALQGWRRNRVYPDFLIKLESDGAIARMLVLETKGKHLEGSPDTEFKEKLFALLEQAYASGKDAGDVELFAGQPDAMRFRILLQRDAWKAELERSLT